jgi:L,D-peptidoglycan transpeptidase YkuD (ErfK/YbiS/YcfS/YnhG family)
MIRSGHSRIRRIAVRKAVLETSRGWLTAGPFRFRAALGKGGIHVAKREGDGRTPAGRFRLDRLWLRPDQAPAKASGLRIRLTRKTDLWCDDKRHRLYNQPTSAPFSSSHENMWRDDQLYDAVIEIGWNMRPAIKGRGSAIFLHLAREGYEPTAGCVALARSDMAKLLPRLARDCRIHILR